MIIKKNLDGDYPWTFGHSRGGSVGRRGGARGRTTGTGATGTENEIVAPFQRYTASYFEFPPYEDAVANFLESAEFGFGNTTPVDVRQTPKLDSLLLPLERGVQKQIIGEILYPTVQVILRTRTTSYLAYARKITGIFMELSITTLLDLQRTLPALEIRVNEEFDNLQARGFDPNGPEATQSPVFRE